MDGSDVSTGGRARVRFRIEVLVAFGVLFLGACAEGQQSAPDVTADAARDTESLRDLRSDAGDSASDAPPDTTAETSAPACSAGVTRCQDAATLQTCKADGSGWADQICPTGCAGTACQPPAPVCSAGQARCTAYNALATCSADGQSESTQTCGAGRCLGDRCNAGKGTGEPCATAGECAGARCLCSDVACAAPSLAAGYCTTATCDVLGCAPNEVCANLSPGAGDLQVCVKDCGACADAGFGCRDLPTGSGAASSWAPACFALDGLGEVGAACQTDADCVAGLCLGSAPSGATIAGGYCSARCTTQGGCPADAACVAVAGYLGGGGFCALDCVVGAGGVRSCPAERPSTFDLDCFLFGPADGGLAVSVCFQQ